MSLRAELETLRWQMDRALQLGEFARLQAEVAVVGASGTLKGARHAGDMAPDFALCNSNGVRTSLSKLITSGSVVITFYRGDWCQFCRLFLKSLSAIHDRVASLDAHIVALSPQPVSCRDGRLHFPFQLLLDTGGRVARRYGLDFTPDPALRQVYASIGQPEDRQTVLPVPATYIVERSGRIVFSYVDSDFMSRLEPDEIVTALQRLQSKTR